MSNTDLQNRDKLNHLLRMWPAGTVMAQAWLETQGVSRQLSHFYQSRGRVEKVGQGAFAKAGDRVDWTGGLYTVQQQLNFKVHLGGLSVLELRGHSHFVPLGKQRVFYLYPSDPTKKPRLPHWFLDGFKDNARILYVARQLFSKPIGLASWEQSNYSLTISSRERALMEALLLLPQQLSYSHAYLLFQGQETLRAELIQQLLECCLSYKVKRLFLHLAKKCCLAWLERLNLEKIDLGRGKRQIGSGGIYDKDNMIAIPKLNTFDDPDLEVEV